MEKNEQGIVKMSEDMRQALHLFCKTHLNEEQQNAVFPEKGIIVVRAGAGSGKTRVITTRIRYLMLEHAIPAHRIVALTFTNKAALEMKERVHKGVAPSEKIPHISTFHAYSLILLKQYGHLIGLSDFTIMDSSDRDKLLSTLLKQENGPRKITTAHLSGAISRYKNSISSLKTAQPLWNDERYGALFKSYERERTAARCLDFDDLLVELLRLLETSPQCKKTIQEELLHLLVDEYQDTNLLQHALIKQLAFGENKQVSLASLCIVGDENQSIYSWRGATVDNMLNFASDFPHVLTIAMTQNYRSVQPVLETANGVIAHNKQHVPHTLWSGRTADDRVRFVTCSSSYQEGDLIAHCARSLQSQKKLHRIAVLYRSHTQSRALEEAFIRASIPYKIVGGTQFYDRLEIKDLLAYLKYAVNPYDRVSFERALTTPSRGLGEAFVAEVVAACHTETNLSLLDRLDQIRESKQLSAKKQAALTQFTTLIHDLRASSSTQEALELILARTQFITYLQEAYEKTEAMERTANVRELVGAVTARMEKGTITIAQFLDEVALLQDQLLAKDDTDDYVSCMTLHGAKGLEFDIVFIPGLAQQIFPSAHTCYNPEQLEEERRLFYVGITRAKEHLVITRSRIYYLYGAAREHEASLFVDDLAPGCVTFLDVINSSFSNIAQEMANWLGPITPTRTAQPYLSRQKINAPPVAATRSYKTVWKTGTRVQHALFGGGTVIGSTTHNDVTILTIQFLSGLKKIVDRFVTAVVEQ